VHLECIALCVSNTSSSHHLHYCSPPPRVSVSGSAAQGMGREAPNTNPHLPEPEGRIKFSLLHPLDFLRDCLGDNFCNKVTYRRARAGVGMGRGQMFPCFACVCSSFISFCLHSSSLFLIDSMTASCAMSCWVHLHSRACVCVCFCCAVDPAHIFERIRQRLILPRPHDHVAAGSQLGDGQVSLQRIVISIIVLIRRGVSSAVIVRSYCNALPTVFATVRARRSNGGSCWVNCGHACCLSNLM